MAHTIAEIQATVARLAKEYGAERVYLALMPAGI